jgi:predicted DNA-binding transcriptional regulator AlpA
MNRARTYLGAMKGVKAVSYEALVRLVQEEGLPTTPNPFNPGVWAFRQSDIDAWYQRYTTPSAQPMARTGRPRRR